jgi:hypothetical protein
MSTGMWFNDIPRFFKREIHFHYGVVLKYISDTTDTDKLTLHHRHILIPKLGKPQDELSSPLAVTAMFDFPCSFQTTVHCPLYHSGVFPPLNPQK